MAVSTQILTTITASEWENFEKFIYYMPPLEEFALEIGETLDVYNRMLTDEEIASALEIRKRALLSYNWTISPASEDENDIKVKSFIEDALNHFNFSRLLEQCLTALEYGFSVVEIKWAQKDGYWLPADSMLLKPERFRLTFDPNILYMVSPVQKKMNTQYKFIIHKHGIQPESPYGISVLRRCYWPWRFKRAGWEFWLITAEKFGVPSILAIMDIENARTPQEIEERARFIAQALANLKTDSAVALAGTKEVKIIETKGMGDFEKLIELCNRAITKAITGQTLATGEGKYGTRAQASVHENILYEIVDSDAKALADTINNSLIKWLVELNFGMDVPVPTFNFDLEEDTPWDRIKDAIDRGVPLSKKALYQKYGLPQPEDDEDKFVSPKITGDLFFADQNRKEFADDSNNQDTFFLNSRRRQRIFLLIS